MIKTGKPPKLTIELVPNTSHFVNLRSLLTQGEWDRIRRKAYRAANYCCQVCGGKGPRHPVECHEIWHYDEDRLIQKLTGLIALCPACHEVKHIGLAATRGRLPHAMLHFCRVNDWSPEDAGIYIQRAFDEYRRRSNFSWSLDTSFIKDY